MDSIYDEIKKNLESEEEKEHFLSYLKDYKDSQIKSRKNHEIIMNSFDDFFYHNTIYYNKTSKVFFNYIQENYIPYNEDNMIYYILDYLTASKEPYSGQKLDTCTKQTMKNKIIRHIKEVYNIYDNIADSESIQYLMNFLVPGIFKTKDEAKFFMTVLGDILMKKYTHKKVNIFTKSCFKDFLADVNKYMSIYFTNINIFNYFKFKFIQDHSGHENYLLCCNDINYKFFNLNKQYFIDLICVSIYYSTNRYGSALEFIQENILDTDIKKSICFFEHNDSQTILDKFSSKYLLPDPDHFITEKEILFLWKKYCSESNLFINIFCNNQEFILKLFESKNVSYQTTCNNNILYGFYSLETPNISHFIDFWNGQFVFDENEYYFELSEILYIYKENNKHRKYELNEHILTHIIQCNFSNYKIIDQKMIHNLKCLKWNKKQEIIDFIQSNDININKNNNTYIYKKYCKSKPKNIMKIGKKYFTMYLNELRE